MVDYNKMPKCKTCNEQFNFRVKVDGKDKYLGNRVNCYECSPIGEHDCSPLATRDNLIDPDGDSECLVCDRIYLYDRSKGHTRNKCGTCSVNQRRFNLKIRMLEYKGGKCSTCGYDRCSRAMVFHHLDESEKDFTIAGNHCRKWETIQAELDKCILLCANCHFELHDKQDGAIVSGKKSIPDHVV